LIEELQPDVALPERIAVTYEAEETQQEATMTMRVLLADDHPAVRAGIRGALEKAADMEVVGEAGDGQTALRLVAEFQPDVVLVDYRLPDMPGSEVARRIEEQGLATCVLAFSAYTEAYYLYQMFQAGVAGYLLKTEPLETVVAAVRVVARGKQWWTAKQIARVLYWQTEVQEPWESLTEREREVLDLLAEGLDNATSAEALCVTTKTVAYHVANILSKLNVASRLEAVVWMHKHLPDDLVKLPG